MFNQIKGLVKNLNGLHSKIAKDAHVSDSKLVCTICGETKSLTEQEFAENLAKGWPKCHNFTMRLVTGNE